MTISQVSSNTKRQLVREELDWMTATQKAQSQVINTIEGEQEYSLNYGKKILMKLLPEAAEFMKTMTGRAGNSTKLWQRYIKQRFIAENFKGIEPIINMVCIVMTSNLSTPLTLPVLAKKMSEYFFDMYNIPFEERNANNEEVIQDAMAFFEKAASYIAEHSEVFVIDNTKIGSYIIELSDEWKLIVGESKIKLLEEDVSLYKPMLVKPVPHTDLTSGNGGFLNTQSPLYKNFLNNKVVSDCNTESNPVLFKTINQVQETPYVINTKLLDVINEYKEQGMWFKKFAYTMKDCHQRYVTEVKDSIDMESKRILVKDKFLSYSKKLEKELLAKAKMKAQAEADKTNNLLAMANNDRSESNLFFPVFFDYRGRRYVYPNQPSYQGDELSKALVQFANKAPLDSTGVRRLYIALANCRKLDKRNIETRLSMIKTWWLEHKDEFMTGDYSLFFTKQEEFDEPINALAITLELVEYWKDHSYECGYICHSDARCSGASIIGTMLNDAQTMRLTSVLEDEEIGEMLPDAYTFAANAALKITTDMNTEMSNKLLEAKDILFSRSAFKNPTMTRCSYGLTDEGLRGKVFMLFSQNKLNKKAGFTKEHIALFFDILKQALDTVLPACSYYLDKMKEVAKDVLENKKGVIEFRDPLTGLACAWKTKKVAKKTIEVAMKHRVIKTVVYRPTDEIDSVGTINSMAANITHHVDSTLLLEVQKLVDCDLSTIHDSIGCHPNNVNIVREAYNKVMVLLNREDYLNALVSQFSSVRIDKISSTFPDVRDILNSKHSLS